MFKPVGLFDQVEPSYSSVLPTSTVVKPPNAKPAVCVPDPANAALAVFKFPPGPQDVPLYSSVAAELPQLTPPKARPAVCVPAPPN